MAAAGLGTAEQDTTGRLQDARAGHRGHSAAARPRPRHQRARPRDGQTAVHGAAHARLRRRHHASWPRKGAKLDTADKDGFTPLDVALGQGGRLRFLGSGRRRARGHGRGACAISWRRALSARTAVCGALRFRASAALQNRGIGSHSCGIRAHAAIREHNARRAEITRRDNHQTATSRVLRTFRPNGRNS